MKNASEISRSSQNFPRPTFFEVPFAAPYRNFGAIEIVIFNCNCNSLIIHLVISVPAFIYIEHLRWKMVISVPVFIYIQHLSWKINKLLTY